MTDKNNSTCAICGKGYYLCMSCKSHNLTPWKLHTDTAEHYKIFQILRGVFLNVYTKEEAKKKLNNIDLSDLDTFRDSVKLQIKDILDYKSNIVTAKVNSIVSDVLSEETSKVEIKKRKTRRKSVETVETE